MPMATKNAIIVHSDETLGGRHASPFSVFGSVIPAGASVGATAVKKATGSKTNN